MKKILFNLFALLILLISSLSFFIDKDYFFDENTSINYSISNESNYSRGFSIKKIVVSANTIKFWLEINSTYFDTYLNLKIYNSSEDELLLEQGNIWYIPYNPLIYGEDYDPSDYNTWTSDPVPSSYGPSFVKRWYFEIPGFIDNVGGSSSNWDDYENRYSIPVRLYFEPNKSYVIKITTKGGTVFEYDFTTKSKNTVGPSDSFGLVESIYRDSYGNQIFRINTKINGNSWGIDNSLLNIRYEIKNSDSDSLVGFSYDEVKKDNYYDFVAPEPLPTGYYNNYKMKISYDNGSYYISDSDTLEQTSERTSFSLPVHDSNNSGGFIVSEDLYVDFSKPPKINYIDNNKIEFSFYLYNSFLPNLDDKISIVDSDKNEYKSILLSDTYNGTYNGWLKYEIYDLDYKKDYEIFVLIDDVILNSNFSYFENLFYDRTITTKDKYPNIMIFNYILFVIIFIFLIATPYLLYEGTKTIF